MLDTILYDIDPVKSADQKLYLKEMNDLVFLITIGQGPLISANSVDNVSDNQVGMSLTENDYTIKYLADLNAGALSIVRFELRYKGKQIMELSHTVRKNHSINMRVVINTSNESMVRKEIERGFKRSISLDGLRLINGDYAEQIEEQEKLDTADQEKLMDENEEMNEVARPALKNIDTAEITEELNALSDSVLKAIREVDEMIRILNGLSHDFTRGSAPNFENEGLKEEMLENGAKVELIDANKNGFDITFRKGSLDEISEVSFFLEKEGELIFSLYFSSLGQGKITARGDNASLIIKRLKKEIGI